VDEYGGTRGMVTMEDLIEELVGDIADEHDIVEELVQQLSDDVYLLDARIPLDELNERVGLKIEDEEFNTLGGHVFGVLGREPKVGDEVGSDRYSLRVEEADRHRILKLTLTVLHPAEEKPSTSKQTDSNGQKVIRGENQSQNGASKPIETTK
ncbi:MAG: transporter associated domain-containing protein, partial [Candidatus Saccharimonadales bacterium]